jgi:hypothetical protein
MKPITLVSCIGIAVMLAACGGGGASSTPSVSNTSATVQQVYGTLFIGDMPSSSAASNARKPAYVSAAATHASVFINGSATTAGTTTTCSATTGTGTGCTISWSTALAVPNSYTFTVEIDNGSKILAVGKNTYALIAGANTLSALTLNGVVAQASFTVTSCPTAATCNGSVTLADAAGDAIAYTGVTAVPTAGNNPTTGTIFDNGSVTLASSNATNGLVSGIAQSVGGTFSTFASSTLTIGGVETAGAYTYSVTCNAEAGPAVFGITVGGASTPSGDLTPGQLTTLGAVSYPAGPPTVTGTAPSFSCTAGTISSATGTLPVN